MQPDAIIASLSGPLNRIVIEAPKGTYRDFGASSDYLLKGVIYPVDYGYLPGYLGEDKADLDFFVGSTENGHSGYIRVSRPDTENGETKFFTAVTEAEIDAICKEFELVLIEHKTFQGTKDLLEAIEAFRVRPGIPLRELLTVEKAKNGNTLFIAIDGRGGSGKSTLAGQLTKKLNAQLVQTDDFASWDNPFNWWPLVIEHVFEPIKNGATTLSYPRSKWWGNHHPEPIVNQPVTKIMIIEGVSSLRKEFRDYISIGIFVDTPREICLQRGIERDIGYDTGKTEAEITAMWEKWAAAEDEYINRDQPQKYADIVIDGTKPLETQL